MAIIDPSGLFLGERLGWCSDDAQLQFPRLYCAANNFARMELDYTRIVTKAYATFKKPISEEKFWALIREYRDNFLLFVWEVNGVMWGQWQTNERYLYRHKNAEDKRSPSPPLDAQDKFRESYLVKKKQGQRNQLLSELRTIAQEGADLLGVAHAGVGVGGGEGMGLDPKPLTPEPSASEAPFLQLPTNRKGISFPVTEAHLGEWLQLYPAIDVRQQVRNMRGWLDGHPEHRKTSKGMPAFIHRWLSKAQNQGGSNGTSTIGGNNGGTRGAAVGRVERGQSAFRAAAIASVEAAGGFAAGSDDGGIPFAGVASGHSADVPARSGDAGGGVWDPAGADSARIVPDAPEILPPSQRNQGGPGSHGSERAH